MARKGNTALRDSKRRTHKTSKNRSGGMIRKGTASHG